MWTQIVGKVKLELAPLLNEWWQVGFTLTARGLTTSTIPFGRRVFQVDFDFIDHRLDIRLDDGTSRSLLLLPRSVADFYHQFMAALEQLGIRVQITTIEGNKAPADQSTIEANKKIVRAYVEEMFNAYKPDRAADFVAPEVKWHGGTLGTVEGRENVLGLLRGFIGALPDLHATEQGIVAVRFTIEATQQGDLFGIPAAGRSLRWDAVDIYRLSNGKIVEEWAADDMVAVLQQLGAYTPAWLR